MNGIVKSVLSINTFKNLVNPLKNNSVGKSCRLLWSTCNSSVVEPKTKPLLGKGQLECSSHNVQFMHTKGEKELAEFLSEEIVAEKKAQKIKNVPSELDGFKVKLDGAEVTLTKDTSLECIQVSFNVNHTVDAEGEAQIDPTMDKPDFAEMKSRPTFEVDIIRNGKTLSFTCSFMQEPDATDDVFGIDEVTMYEGEWNDKTYAVAGDVLDGYLYDLLMNLLEEKGITNEFAEKIADFSTVYEHSAYVGLLEGLSRFTMDVSQKASK
ncbi:complement component 1 Q subcomponent-binding protein, mitochondrial-like isoform X2 [Ctenocephalides felis]|uniref:complement component 1 Q subcomponent-binding protein, mitochondrial-like isoform X2 n=1 Tax=Ctenocephalides felis TaxID=7515 RepID=UPI000E6E405A|nr:complement component 1 Q subcomponent-binding protein, mitochondrial-like isoform X2 [Ctenocephalides felis]